jgi:uncharacterized Zn-finger protein
MNYLFLSITLLLSIPALGMELPQQNVASTTILGQKRSADLAFGITDDTEASDEEKYPLLKLAKRMREMLQSEQQSLSSTKEVPSTNIATPNLGATTNIIVASTTQKTVDTNNPFKCPQCPSTLSSLKNLNRHILNQHGADSVWVKCDLPGCKFEGKKSNLFNHMRTHGPEINHFIIDGYNGSAAQTINSKTSAQAIKQDYFVCTLCPNKFKSFQAIKTHLGQTHKKAAPYKQYYTQETQFIPKEV